MAALIKWKLISVFQDLEVKPRSDYKGKWGNILVKCTEMTQKWWNIQHIGCSGDYTAYVFVKTCRMQTKEYEGCTMKIAS